MLELFIFFVILVYKLFVSISRNANAREWWEEWVRSALPPENLDPSEYVSQLRRNGIKVSQPLAFKLYDPDYTVGIADGATWIVHRNLIEDQSMTTEFPLVRAVSGNSVITDFNPNPDRYYKYYIF
jgi:hypothetical protein